MTDNGPPKAKNYDPGWNDPPTLSYSGTATPNRAKTILNKRVAFPLQNAATSNQQGSATSTIMTPPTVPPLSSCAMAHAAKPPLSCDYSSTKTTEITATPHLSVELTDETDARIYVLKVLRECAKSITDTVNLDEIVRRLDKMDSMWTENKYSSDVEQKLLNIAKALESKNINEANELHRSLVIDHLNQCSQWSTALRHLILTVESKPTS